MKKYIQYLFLVSLLLMLFACNDQSETQKDESDQLYECLCDLKKINVAIDYYNTELENLYKKKIPDVVLLSFDPCYKSLILNRFKLERLLKTTEENLIRNNSLYVGAENESREYEKNIKDPALRKLKKKCREKSNWKKEYGCKKENTINDELLKWSSISEKFISNEEFSKKDSNFLQAHFPDLNTNPASERPLNIKINDSKIFLIEDRLQNVFNSIDSLENLKKNAEFDLNKKIENYQSNTLSESEIKKLNDIPNKLMNNSIALENINSQINRINDQIKIKKQELETIKSSPAYTIYQSYSQMAKSLGMSIDNPLTPVEAQIVGYNSQLSVMKGSRESLQFQNNSLQQQLQDATNKINDMQQKLGSLQKEYNQKVQSINLEIESVRTNSTGSFNISTFNLNQNQLSHEKIKITSNLISENLPFVKQADLDVRDSDKQYLIGIRNNSIFIMHSNKNGIWKEFEIENFTKENSKHTLLNPGIIRDKKDIYCLVNYYDPVQNIISLIQFEQKYKSDNSINFKSSFELNNNFSIGANEIAIDIGLLNDKLMISTLNWSDTGNQVALKLYPLELKSKEFRKPITRILNLNPVNNYREVLYSSPFNWQTLEPISIYDDLWILTIPNLENDLFIEYLVSDNQGLEWYPINN